MTQAPELTPSARIADAIAQLQGVQAIAHRRQLSLIAAYDRDETWKEEGATSMKAWLAGMLGMAHGTAAETVRVAHALEGLPAIASAYEQGLLAWDQVRAVTRFATADTDDAIASEAPKFSAAHLFRIAARHCPVTSLQEATANDARHLKFNWDANARLLRFSGALPAAEGAVLVAAVDRIANQAPPDPSTNELVPYARRCADALVQMASARIASDQDADRATVGIHIDVGMLVGEPGPGMAELSNGTAIAAETARRLACDSRWYVIVDGPDGGPIGIGRTSRQVPAWLSREIKHRDLCCRFPTCERQGWLSAHHIVHWVDGGRTDLDNLILLCGEHHRLLHEGGGKISGDANGDLVFTLPNGRVFVQGPPALREDIRKRLEGVTDTEPETEDAGTTAPRRLDEETSPNHNHQISIAGPAP